MEEEIKYPSHFSNAISSVVSIFEDYGWYMLVSLIVLAYLYQTSLRALIAQYQKKRDEEEYSAKYHKNPDLLSARLKAQEKRTLELQQMYQKSLEEHKTKLEEKEARKLAELCEKFGNEGGQRLGSSDEKKSKKSFKPDYNPLMGSGSSSNYRPPKRSACSGGGCGK